MTIGGQADPLTLILQKYMDQIMKLTNQNHDMYYTLIKVIHMLEQPTALFHPKFIIKVLQQIIKEKFSTAETHYEQIPTVIS
ncbi:MAG: hypothetical protein AAFO04_20660 [Cyanobacteria bacterium J06592_8]